jgi:hypothetical protein
MQRPRRQFLPHFRLRKLEIVTTTQSYQTYCWRDEAGWWMIEVPGVASEVRRLDQGAPA